MNHTRLSQILAKRSSTAYNYFSAALNSATHIKGLKMVQGDGFEPSKLTRQIYSLIPLAAREPLRKFAGIFRPTYLDVNLFSNKFTGLGLRALLKWSWREELNPRPADYKSAALPTELRQPF